MVTTNQKSIIDTHKREKFLNITPKIVIKSQDKRTKEESIKKELQNNSNN